MAIALVVALAMPVFAADAQAFLDSGVAAAAALPMMLSEPVVMAAADGTVSPVSMQIYDFTDTLRSQKRLSDGTSTFYSVPDIVLDFSDVSVARYQIYSTEQYNVTTDASQVVTVFFEGHIDTGLDGFNLYMAYQQFDDSYAYEWSDVVYDPNSGYFSASYSSNDVKGLPFLQFVSTNMEKHNPDLTFISVDRFVVSLVSPLESGIVSGLDAITGTSSYLPFSSGSLSADLKSKNGSLGSVVFGEQPAGDYLININHSMTDCTVDFNVYYKDRYLYTSSSPGVTTCLVSHEGGDLSLTVSYSAQRTTAYEVTGGYVEGESSVSGEGVVVGSGSVTSSGGVYGSTSSGTINPGMTSQINPGSINSNFVVNGNSYVSGSSSVEGSGYVTGEIYTTAPTAWSFSVSSIVAISVVGAAADQYGFFGPFVGFFKDFLPEQLAGIKASLYSGFTRMTDKLQEIFDKQEQSYEDATDEAVSEGYDDVAGKHEEEDAYTQDAISNVDQTFDALELPSLEEQQTVIDGISLLNVAVFDGFFANTQMRFLLFFSLSLALASFVLRMSS